MKTSPNIPKRMLKVERLNYRRQCCSFVSLIISTCIFILLFLSQSGFLTCTGKSKSNFWVTIDFISVLGAILSFICSLVLIFLIEQERSKIQKKIAAESQTLGFRSRKEAEKKRRELLDRCGAFCEGFSLKMDFLGTSCNFSMQLASLIFLLTNGLALGEIYKFGSHNLPMGHVVDLVSNAAYFLAALLLVIAHLIGRRKEKTPPRHAREMAQVMTFMFLGSSLIFAGKIVCVLEAIGTMTPPALKNGATLPIGWLTRTVGIILLAINLGMVLKRTSDKCDALAKIVEDGENSHEVFTMVSTQDVRSCFGYLEYGTR